MRIDEVYFFRFDGDRLDSMWGVEDTWTRLGQLFGAERAGDLAVLGAPDLALSEEAPRVPVLTFDSGRCRTVAT